ncbi:M20/M25/M40 family metallo-hydrolase [Agromyces salentinus]|uniref:Dipeptidase n=1 Tax=Agromyces salentinus TaxID=269421 RepID=A0ABN2MNV5_9MICO|nr:M20/M25/M40 family metallo-hydrolase [Agromyces salentinus]
MAAKTPDDDVRRFLRDRTASMVSELSEWVRIPSIAAVPEHAIDVRRSARWLAGAFRTMGLRTQLIGTGETEAVLARLHVDDRLPTVLVYSHHDVRHAKPEEWAETHPFEPVLRDGRLFGRGASDAKGQVMAHLQGLRAHLALLHGDRPAVNLTYLIEGEEELGSPHLEQLLGEHASILASDAVVFSDTIQWAKGDPAVVTSVRGMVPAVLRVFGPERDVHSGTVSGAAPNPMQALVEVLARLHDDRGRIMLPGFADHVEEPAPARVAELARLPFDEADWLRRTETRSVRGEAGFSVPERLWLRPALEIVSLLGGDPEGIARAVIPAEASASLSIRTVPNQTVATVADQVRAFVAEAMPDGVAFELEVDETTAQEPYLTPEGPALAALERAAALGLAAGGATAPDSEDVPRRMGNAGGGPAELLARSLDAPVLFLGTGLPEDHWHASDESVDVDMLVNGAATICHLWSELAELPVSRR